VSVRSHLSIVGAIRLTFVRAISMLVGASLILVSAITLTPCRCDVDTRRCEQTPCSDTRGISAQREAPCV